MPNNLLLAALSAEDLDRLHAHLTPVQLERGTVLEEAGRRTSHVYFPEGLLASIVARSDDGVRMEAGLVGCEGVTGSSDLLGSGTSSHLVEVQEAGAALRMDAALFKKEFAENLVFQELVMWHHQYLFGQVSQTALCNRAHTIRGRLSRWILMSQDAVQSDTLHTTQEYLSLMLGAQRPGLTRGAQALRQAGGIAYTKRSITIVDRATLETLACGCYVIGKGQRAQLLAGAANHDSGASPPPAGH